VKKAILLLALVASALLSGPENRHFTVHDRAYYLDPKEVAFIRPGLVLKIFGGTVAPDGTITAAYTVTDPAGLPLDNTGVTTPGPISVSFIAAYIPTGTSNWLTMTSRKVTAPNGNTANQPATDSGGKTTTNSIGNYTYTFGTKAPANFDRTQTVRIAAYASRDLTAFDLGTAHDNSVFTFVPNGSPVTNTHDIVATKSCDRCHDPLSAHGGARLIVPLCITCHNPGGDGVQTIDPDTGNSLDFQVMIHKIHMGSSLPSVQAGQPYQIIGFNNSVNDFSDVVFPAMVQNCQMCHEVSAYPRKSTIGIAYGQAGLAPAPLNVDANGNVIAGSQNSDTPATPTFPGTGDSTSGPAGASAIPVSASAFSIPGGLTEPPPVNSNWWLTRPTAAACGACHDDVNFQTGKNHPGGPQPNDSLCSICHIPQGELPFDASILGAHTIPLWTPGVMPGVVFQLTNVTGGAAGKSPTVTFTIKDYGGNAISASNMNSLSLVMGGPTAEYQTYVSESAISASATSTPGTFNYTFKAPVPANATGTWSVGIEGYKNFTILPGTTKATTVRDVGFNQLYLFSVDGSPVTPHAYEHIQQDCNACHYRISFHGTIRQNVQYCLICHNPTNTDSAQRPANQNPPQTIDFPVLIHRLHAGSEAPTVPGGQLTPFVVYGFGGNPTDFSDVRYPGYLGDCGKCHVNQSDFPPVPASRINVTNPRAFINPSPPNTAACTACHTAKDVSSHAASNTTSLGESCGVCHGVGATFNVDQVHARTL
jgi:hypothetical protein